MLIKLVDGEIEKSVEEYLEDIVEYLDTPSEGFERILRIGAWVFNSTYGSHELFKNEHSTEPSYEEDSKHHAEQFAISNMPKEYWTEGQNTIFTTLAPCNFCVDYMIDQQKNLKGQYKTFNVIYFSNNSFNFEKSMKERSIYRDFIVNQSSKYNSFSQVESNFVKALEQYMNSWRKNKKPTTIRVPLK